MTTAASAKDKIIVPLDVPGAADAVRVVHALTGIITYYKIGLELFTRCGPDIVEQVRAVAGQPCRIFLDLKLHDIPNTVRHAVRAAAALEIDLLTVHLSGGGAMLRAAAEEAGDKLLLLGVTVLTSSDEATLRETGVAAGSVKEQVLRLAALGAASGLRGVVASPLEIRALRASLGTGLRIVTPGVRPAVADAPPDDQRRVLTPREAVQAGADFLVIGRPITARPDPRRAAQEIVDEIEGAGVPAA